MLAQLTEAALQSGASTAATNTATAHTTGLAGLTQTFADIQVGGNSEPVWTACVYVCSAIRPCAVHRKEGAEASACVFVCASKCVCACV